jgi:hypothetical protein
LVSSSRRNRNADHHAPFRSKKTAGRSDQARFWEEQAVYFHKQAVFRNDQALGCQINACGRSDQARGRNDQAPFRSEKLRSRGDQMRRETTRTNQTDLGASQRRDSIGTWRRGSHAFKANLTDPIRKASGGIESGNNRANPA